MVLKLVQTIQAHEGKGWSIAWHPKGEKFISVGEDKVAKVWQRTSNPAEPWALLTKFGESSHKKTIRDAAWSPCGNFVVLASFDAQISLWEIKNGRFQMLSVVEGHESEVKGVAWSPSGRYFASCGRDKNVMIWTMITETDDDTDVECAGVMTAHTQDVKRVVWHPYEDILASCSYDDTLKLYVNDENDGDWSTLATITGHQSTVWAIDYDALGKRIASCSDDKTVKIWTKGLEGKWVCVCTIPGYHSRSIYDISWSKLNGLIATGAGDNYIRIFQEQPAANELERHKFDMVFSVKVTSHDVNCVTWNPVYDKTLLSVSDDGIVRVWEWQNEI